MLYGFIVTIAIPVLPGIGWKSTSDRATDGKSGELKKPLSKIK